MYLCYNSVEPIFIKSMDKIIFFDIDGTLFNPKLFLENFYVKLSEKFVLGNEFHDKLQAIYEQTRNEKGHFIPSFFLEKIIENFPQINIDGLKKIFWDIDLFKKSMYKDTSALIDLSKLASIGIFSKGEGEFQKNKLSSIKNLLDDKNIYIFPDKIKEINGVFGKYTDYKVFFVDNDIDVIEKAKSLTSNVFAILIDRSNNYVDNTSVTRVESLNQIQNLI